MAEPVEVVARGVVNSNGQLELDPAAQLPVGPVEVIVRTISQQQSNGSDWWQVLQNCRRQLEHIGYHFMDDAETAAWIDELRSEDDRIEQAAALNGDSVSGN